MAPFADLNEEDKAEIDRLIRAARYDIEKADRLTKRAKGILTKAHYYLVDGPASQNHGAEEDKNSEVDEDAETEADADGGELEELEVAPTVVVNPTPGPVGRALSGSDIPASIREAMMGRDG